MPCAHVAAQGWIEPLRPIPAFPRGAITKERSVVQVAVTGRVARVTVEEWFRNAGPVLDEGSYLYPLPGEAVFSDFSLWQGD
ncbi:MAG TPA: VIT domain-containing protein, partial [Gemmatimonadales bacterium]|nr:VIT domain-containing protein [Gemmatimonadales bacterium]